MSAVSNGAPVPCRVHPRHFHAGPNPQQPQPQLPVAEEPEETPSPAVLLYRHALESVFAFCSLAELAAVNAVSHDWQAAVLSMAPLQCEVEDCNADRLTAVCSSPLRQHVSSISYAHDSTTHPAFLLLLTQTMPHLRTLDARVHLFAAPLHFPPRLTKLELFFLGEGESKEKFATRFNSTIDVVARLAYLEALTLSCSWIQAKWSENCSLAALSRAPKLHRLALAYMTLTGTQVAELRALSNLEVIRTDHMDETVLNRLLAQPHNLRWQEAAIFPGITDAIVPLLLSLPLHRLDAYLSMTHADFLPQLPHLTELEITSNGDVPLDAESILQVVGQCGQLRELRLCDISSDNDFTDAQFSACLARLTRLQKLYIASTSALTTLAFLARGSLPRTLTSLELLHFDPRLPLTELKHVLCLRVLRTLELINVFDEPLGKAGELLFQPPFQSERMPQLTHFEHHWVAP